MYKGFLKKKNITLTNVVYVKQKKKKKKKKKKTMHFDTS